MKKLLLSLAIASISVLNVTAQNTGEFQFGIGGGINFSNVSIDNDDAKTNPITSFNAALSAEYYFGNRLGVKTKLIYDNKGWGGETTDTTTNTTINTEYNLTYITVPIMANWHFGSLQSRSKSFVTRPWYVSLGPYIGFLTNATESESGKDFKKELKGFDYGAAFNFGLRFEIADFTKLYVEYDAQYGLADISAGATTSNINDDTAIKNGLRNSVNVGLLFAFY